MVGLEAILGLRDGAMKDTVRMAIVFTVLYSTMAAVIILAVR